MGDVGTGWIDSGGTGHQTVLNDTAKSGNPRGAWDPRMPDQVDRKVTLA